MIAGSPWCPVRYRLVTVPNDLFTIFTSPFLSEWVKCQRGNTQNGGSVLPIANLMADSESESTVSYSSFLVTICLSQFLSPRRPPGDRFFDPLLAGCTQCKTFNHMSANLRSTDFRHRKLGCNLLTNIARSVSMTVTLGRWFLGAKVL